ncbi:MAG: asparagine synthase-related protein [Rhizomicrobium sp.]
MRDPHTDRRLTEFLAAVPDRIFRLNGEPRAFARLVLADRLPAEILNKRVLGLQAPSWFRALDARRDALAQDVESIAASPLASRLIDVPRLKRLIADWPADEHAAQRRKKEFKLALARGIHVGKFIRWVEGGNA